MGIEADRDLFLANAAGRLDEYRQADATQLAVALGVAAAALEALPVGLIQRLLEQPRRIPLS